MTILEMQEEIKKGAKFNGTVYGRDHKHFTTLFIYLNGVVRKITDVNKSEVKEKKAEYENILRPKTSASFGDVYQMHGMDVAVGEADL